MVAVYAASELSEYGFGNGHPFGNDRLAAFWSELVRRGLDRRVSLPGTRLATDEELERFHHREYLKRARSVSRIGFGFLDRGDTPAKLGIFEAASRVAGTALLAVDTIMRGDDPRAFLPIAGLHHGRRGAAEGFCVLNDCGIVIETLKAVWGLDRIAYVDIDAHHGDGVYYEFEDDPALVTADIHENGEYLFPGTGETGERGRGAALGLKLNIPLEPGAGNAEFFSAWPDVLAHVASFEPDFVMFQAGADSIAGDPLTHLELTPAAHRHACETLCEIADRFADGRLLAMGGGGYNRENLARTWCEVVEALLTA